MNPEAVGPVAFCAGVLCTLAFGAFVAVVNWLRWRGEEEEAWPLDLRQPPPAPSTYPRVWDLLRVDLEERVRQGRENYGDYLRPHNGRDQLKDLLAELLDACFYCRTAIYERDGE